MRNEVVRHGAAAGSILAALAVWGACAAEAAGQEIRNQYVVSLDDAASQHVDVTLTLREVRGESIDLMLPVWRPGRYVVLDMAGSVIRASATDGRGGELAVSKVDKTTWRVRTDGQDEVRFSYRLYANSLNDRTRHADDTHAFLSGAAVFVYAPERRHEALSVRVERPEGWRVATGLDAHTSEPDTWVAPGYDVLVDSPIEVGEQRVITFDVGGVGHEIVMWGPANVDEGKLASDFASIVSAQRDLFEGAGGTLPYGRYVFMVHVQPGIGGGTEHLNSTIMQTGPESFRDDKKYLDFLGLVSHEMFHTWNVKRLRPAGLVPYDYQRENYTDLLWIAEGTTSYYDELILARTGLWKVDKYLEALAGMLDREERRPGGRVQSVADSSLDAWIKFNRATPNDVNSTVNFYGRGATISFLLDAEIRSRTGNSATLDVVMRELYQRHTVEGGGFTTGDVLAALERATGTSFSSFFDAYVRGTQTLAIDPALAAFGLERSPAKEPAKGSTLGLSVRDEKGWAAVKDVVDGGPGHAAGLLPDDLLVSLDGRRVTNESFTGALEGLEPGHEVEVVFTRRDALRRATITGATREHEGWRATRVKEPTALQRATYESWIGQAWPDGDDEGDEASEGEKTAPGDP